MSVEGFKRAFQKAFASNKTNYGIRRAKVQEAIDDLEKALVYLRSNNKPIAEQYEKVLARHKKALLDADKQAEKKPGDAFKALEPVKEQARIDAESAQNDCKKSPKSVKAENGTNAKIYPPDIPGFDKMDPREQDKIAQKVANKVGKGKDLFTQVKNNPGFIKNWSPTQEDVSDMMWFIKTRAEESIGQPYERGALTIPDEDGSMRALLDKCSEAYIRDSSHLKKQQSKEDGQARGIDFYEGVEDGAISDIDKLLPAGMRTLLYQQHATGQGKQRLYIKMETESARIRAKFFTKDFYREEVQSRPREWKDWSNSIKHLGNLIKAKLGMSQGEDKALQAYREKVPSSVSKPLDAALEAAKSAAKKNPDFVLGYDILKVAKKNLKQGIFNFWTIYEKLSDGSINLDAATYEQLAKCAEAIFALSPNPNPEDRIGEEVVVTMEDLLPTDTPKKGAPQQPPPQPQGPPPAAAPVVGNVTTPNPMLYFLPNSAGGVNLRVESAPPGGQWQQVDQFCAYLATKWLTSGGGGGLTFAGLGGDQQNAITQVQKWASSGGLNAQVGDAVKAIGGKDTPKGEVTAAAKLDRYAVGTQFWFGTNVHAQAAVVQAGKRPHKYRIYDPNTGAVQEMDGPGFAAYVAADNKFVVATKAPMYPALPSPKNK